MPQGFEDSSWHNDSCPNFTSAELGLRIWIDYFDPAKREISAGGSRFTLEPADNLDDITDPICTDDWAVILAAVKKSAPRSPLASPSWRRPKARPCIGSSTTRSSRCWRSAA
nr:hypothetical protein [Bradyrhizobium sp. 2S1]MCK7670896.1 hypothetical protein [Bradyrhizobium sp. 2S1]